MGEDHIQQAYREIKSADYFLAPSQIVKKSLSFCGAQEEQIRIMPYGADLAKFRYMERTVHDGPLNLIFVGTVNHRKGIHHLLKFVSKMSNEVDLKLVVSMILRRFVQNI